MDGRWTIVAGCLIGLWAPSFADEAHGGVVELRRSWRNDAALHDVQFVGARHAWAVGDHGALWRTADGGRTWTLIDTTTDANLRSVCLLTDEIGWIAGRQIRGSSELASAVLLATRDGGQSWQPLETKSLSPLRFVRFFGLEEGIVVGEPTTDNVTGVWTTADGGQSWQPLEGKPSRGWNDAAIVSPELGLLADREGGVSLLAGPRLLPSKLPALKGRSIRGVALESDQQAWLVGDGGLAMTSKSGGVVWEFPEGELPEDLRQFCDFRTVSVHDDAVWIAGDPGGVVWHSPDGGRRWIRQPTGVTTPINKMHFADPEHGCAVGELGTILTTDDGGESWNIAQGRGRHAALLSIHHRVATLSPELVVKVSGEQGFRSAAWIAVRPPDGTGPLSAAERVSDAVISSGGSSGATAWQLPLDVPGLELNSEKLVEHWQRRTEGQLTQMLLGRLVRQIRAWRPLVLIIDQPAPNDAVGQLIFDATLHAVEQAGDGTRFLMQRELGGLSPWKVERVYLQLLPGSTGEIALDPFELLPRWQTNARMAAATSRAMLGSEASSVVRPNYRAVDSDGKLSPQSRGTDFFSGLKFAAGSDVRREQTPIDDRYLDQQIKAVQRHRNFIAHAERSLDDPQIAGQMLAQVKDVVAGMTAEQAALTLYDLFEEYRRHSRIDLAEATGHELVKKYPEQPITAEAAKWLLICAISEEVAWRNVREHGIERRAKRTDATGVTGFSPVKQVAHQAQVTHLPELKERLKKGQLIARYLEERWPSLSQSPEIQFPLAALSRSRGSMNQADAVYRRWISHTDDQDHRVWADVVRREVWLTQQGSEVPEGIAVCYRTPTKPQLDGLLSDECWQEARELLLARRSPAAMPDVPAPLVMLACDDEFLFVAASVPRIAGQSTDPPKTSGRTHDADLRRHDCLAIRLDTDRDYRTHYTLQVDQRGWTAESCWDDAGWNPQWFVAVDGDTSHWRVELAIPWSELASKRPAAGAAWGISLERTAPAVGRQSWPGPAAASDSGPLPGILRFE